MIDRIRFSGNVLSTMCVVVFTATACSSDKGDSANAKGVPAKTSVTVPMGSSLTFVVGEDISTKTQHAGDEFTATLAGNVAGVDGGVALRDGSPGRWVVSEATNDNGQGEALLAVRLKSVIVNGQSYPVAATVVSSDLQKDPRDSGKETAAKIGVGTAAGALVGRVLGHDAGDAVKGAVVGAALGTAIALSSRSGSATIPAGARITVRLDSPLKLSEAG